MHKRLWNSYIKITTILLNVEESTEEDHGNKEQHIEGDFVTAVYLNRWYVEEVADIDDGQFDINIMKTITSV